MGLLSGLSISRNTRARRGFDKGLRRTSPIG
jgi:hypothetical protein